MLYGKPYTRCHYLGWTHPKIQNEERKKRQKKEMNLNKDPPIKAPACINDRPIDDGVWRKERKSQKQKI